MRENNRFMGKTRALASVLCILSMVCAARTSSAQQPSAGSALIEAQDVDAISYACKKRAPTRVEREAVSAEEQDYLKALGIETADSIFLLSRGISGHVLYELRKPLRYVVRARQGSDADVLNGTDYFAHVAIISPMRMQPYPTHPPGQWEAPKKSDAQHCTGFDFHLPEARRTTSGVWKIQNLDKKQRLSAEYLQKWRPDVVVPSGAGSGSAPSAGGAVSRAVSTESAAAVTVPVSSSKGSKSVATAPQASQPTVSAAVSSDSVSLVGRWIASGESKGKPYRYRFDFVEGANGILSGTFKYEPPGCKGTLVAKSAAPPNYEFNERVDDPLMLLKCGAPAALRVQVPSPGIAVLEKFDPSGGRSLGRVTAMRQGDAESPSAAATAVSADTSAAPPPVDASTTAPSVAAGPVLRMDGAGPVKIGMTVAQAQKALGEKFAFDPTLDDSCNIGQAKKQFPSLSFMTIDGVIARIDTTDPAVRTPEGAHVGSTEQELRKLYGSRAEFAENRYVETSHDVTVLSSDGRVLGIVFVTDGKKIVSMRVGREQEINLAEGCF